MSLEIVFKHEYSNEVKGVVYVCNGLGHIIWKQDGVEQNVGLYMCERVRPYGLVKQMHEQSIKKKNKQKTNNPRNRTSSIAIS